MRRHHKGYLLLARNSRDASFSNNPYAEHCTKHKKPKMNQIIPAIETRYAGCLFRSRLEARWAVFYDSLGIEWRYEPEGFDLKDLGWYLPDFWLPELGLVIEIKPDSDFREETLQKLRLAAEALNARTGLLFYGDIPRGDPAEPYLTSAYAVSGGEWQDSEYWWCECPECGRLDVQFNGRSERMSCHRSSRNIRSGQHNSHGYNSDSPRILNAYEEARSARFI